jgi:hypothetical protein
MPIQLTRTEEGISLGKPEVKPTWTATIQLRDPILGQEILVLYDTIQREPAWRSKTTYDYNIHILKSNLQKAMRRQKLVSVLATGLQLLSQDPSEALRRIAVILLEDSTIQVWSYVYVVWLMYAVGKGYTLRERDVQVIMDALATACEANVRYDLEEEPEGIMVQVPEDKLLGYYGIMLRAGAGGMAFDVGFLKRLAARYARGQLEELEEVESIDFNDIELFDTKEHLLDEAIDFHCCPQILNSQLADAPDMKAAIWWHWSSINARVIECSRAEGKGVQELAFRDETADCWRQIERHTREFARAQRGRFLQERKAKIRNATLDSWLKKSAK